MKQINRDLRRLRIWIILETEKVIFHLAYMIAGYYRLKLMKINYP